MPALNTPLAPWPANSPAEFPNRRPPRGTRLRTAHGHSRHGTSGGSGDLPCSSTFAPMIRCTTIQNDCESSRCATARWSATSAGASTRCCGVPGPRFLVVDYKTNLLRDPARPGVEALVEGLPAAGTGQGHDGRSLSAAGPCSTAPRCTGFEVAAARLRPGHPSRWRLVPVRARNGGPASGGSGCSPGSLQLP